MPLPRAVADLLRWPFRRRALAERIFGLTLPPPRPEDHYFDLVTPALVERAAHRLPQRARLLDLGCGPFALVGLSLWRRIDARVVSTDIDPGLARRALETVRRNGAPLRVCAADGLAALRADRFDAVLFNPPYVPARVGRGFGLPEGRRSQWHGGDDGFGACEAFLEALARLPAPPLALLAVNRCFVSAKRVSEAVAQRPGLQLAESWRARPWPADVHAIHAPRAPGLRRA